MMQAASPTSAEPAGEGDQEDARDRDAHELGRFTVLHGGADRLAEIGRLDRPLQPDRAADRHQEADHQLRLGVERPERPRAAAEQRRHVEQVGRHQHQRDVLHQDRQPHGGEHHDQVRLVERGRDDEPVHQHAEQEHGRHDGDDRHIGVEAEQLGDRPGAVHREHQEFAVREVDDAQHAEGEREADAHQGVDAADENAGKDQLADGNHRAVVMAGRSPPLDRALQLIACPSPAAEPRPARAWQESSGTPGCCRPSATARCRSRRAGSGRRPWGPAASRCW